MYNLYIIDVNLAGDNRFKDYAYAQCIYQILILHINKKYCNRKCYHYHRCYYPNSHATTAWL